MANSGDIPNNISVGAGQAIRRNAGDTAFEAFTPGSGGTGDVVGPSGATDNAIARYDTTTGKLLQDSTNTIDDNGNLTTGKLLKINADTGNPEFDFTEAGTVRAKTYYDVTNNRLTFQNNENNNADALYFTDHLTTTGDITVGGNVTATNLSGTNTGDNATNTTSNTYADGKVSDTAYGAGWNGDTTTAPSKNAVYDKIESLSSGGLTAPQVQSLISIRF